MATASREQGIRRLSLHDELVGRLRELILAGELAPGSRVPEKLLCQRFGVSRTPLREALKVLASEGLLELLPQRGTRVSRLTLDDVEDLFPVVGALEALAGELACQRIDEAGIARITGLHQAMCEAYAAQDRPTYFALNQQIHQQILEATGNEPLITTYRSLSGRIRNARYLANLSQARWRQAIEEHEAILDALSRRDGPALAGLLREHLAHKCETVKEALAETR